VQVIPLYFKSDAAVFDYFRQHENEIDAITGSAVHVIVARSLLEGDALDVASALDAPKRFPSLSAQDLPCLWVETSGGRHFIIKLPPDLEQVKNLLKRLVDAARRATTFDDVAAGFDAQAPQSPRKRIVMTLHGIETRGAWQKEMQASFDQAQSSLQHRPLDFDLFRALSLLIPASRMRKVEWFRDEYTRIVKEEQLGDSLPSIVAHSFGSYIVASAMERYPEVRFDRVILCGAIVRRDYPWSERLRRGQVTRVLNDYGRRDIWVRIAEGVIADAGSSGYQGFEETSDQRLIQRQHVTWRHSDYFYTLNYERNWIPFLVGVRDPDAGDQDPARRVNWRFRIVKAIAFVVAIAAAWFGYATFRSADELQEVQAPKAIPRESFDMALVLGEPVKALSGGSGARDTCGYGRETVKQSCVEPKRTGGYLVPGTITAYSVAKSGAVTGWKVASDGKHLACVEFRAATTACETLVSIEGRAAAQEKFPTEDAVALINRPGPQSSTASPATQVSPSTIADSPSPTSLGDGQPVRVATESPKVASTSPRHKLHIPDDVVRLWVFYQRRGHENQNKKGCSSPMGANLRIDPQEAARRIDEFVDHARGNDARLILVAQSESRGYVGAAEDMRFDGRPLVRNTPHWCDGEARDGYEVPLS
jgi:pimeloyl-ACP methyl ester carboxylesterase